MWASSMFLLHSPERSWAFGTMARLTMPTARRSLFLLRGSAAFGHQPILKFERAAHVAQLNRHLVFTRHHAAPISSFLTQRRAAIEGRLVAQSGGSLEMPPVVRCICVDDLPGIRRTVPDYLNQTRAPKTGADPFVVT